MGALGIYRGVGRCEYLFRALVSLGHAVSGAVLALGGSMLFTNAGILPAESPFYDAVWSYVVPLAIPFFAFSNQCAEDPERKRQTFDDVLHQRAGHCGRKRHCFFLFKDQIPHLDKIGGMISASYIGGGVNFAAMKRQVLNSR